MFVQDGRLVVDYNAFDDHAIVESDDPLPDGDVELTYGPSRRVGRTGTMRLAVDGATVGSVDLPLFMSMMSSVGPSIGEDHGSPVSTRYAAPFAFTGALHEIEIQLLSREDAEAARCEPPAQR